jgi:hypothetical protein
MAKCLASSQSEHGWRAPLNGLCRNSWNVLGRTFLQCIAHVLVMERHGTYWTLDSGPVCDIGWPQAGRAGGGRPASSRGQQYHYRPGTGRLRPALHLETMIST